jgi:DNA-directed RNA polymerase subunit RPC12/RpoP
MLNPLKEVLMTTECPECHERMLVKVGLDASPGDDVVICPACRSRVVALVPGPVLDGPYPAQD